MKTERPLLLLWAIAALPEDYRVEGLASLDALRADIDLTARAVHADHGRYAVHADPRWAAPGAGLESPSGGAADPR